MSVSRRLLLALGVVVLALSAGVAELVAVQAVLADAPITAALLHLASALLMGGCTLTSAARVARSDHASVLRAVVLSLCAPVVGSIAVMAIALPAFRREVRVPVGPHPLRLARSRRSDVAGMAE